MFIFTEHPLNAMILFCLRDRALAAPLGMAHMRGQFRTPQHVVRDHPPIRQINIVLELDGDHLGIDLDYDPLQPIADPFVIPFVIAVNLNAISDLVCLIPVGCTCKM
jgi:hypothetical protein